MRSYELVAYENKSVLHISQSLNYRIKFREWLLGVQCYPRLVEREKVLVYAKFNLADGDCMTSAGHFWLVYGHIWHHVITEKPVRLLISFV